MRFMIVEPVRTKGVVRREQGFASLFHLPALLGSVQSALARADVSAPA
jgi:hypothetical protein